MVPCPSCQRHIYLEEARCPFCAAPQHLVSAEVVGPLSQLAWVATLAVSVALGSMATACSPDASAPLQESTSSTQTSDATGSETTTTASTATTATTESSSMGATESASEDDEQSAAVFYGCAWDGDLGPNECDPFYQDCPDGEKCVAYASMGENYDANKCVPILGDRQVGESCTYSDPIEATDDCDAQSVCLPRAFGHTRTCTAFCTGTIDDPLCGLDPPTDCMIAYEDSWNLCVETCSPLLQDCNTGDICTSFVGYPFFCLPPERDGAAAGETCAGPLECAAGLCVSADVLAQCEGEQCCTDWCDLDAPDCADGLSCTAFYELGQAPPGFENIGLCTAR